MDKVSVLGTITCREGKEEDMEAVLARMVDAARDEPGVEVYSYHRDDQDRFWFFALMADQEVMKLHGQTPAMKAAMEEFGPLMAEPPTMHTARPVAALGLDV